MWVRVNFVGEQDHLACCPGHAAGVWLSVCSRCVFGRCVVQVCGERAFIFRAGRGRFLPRCLVACQNLLQ